MSAVDRVQQGAKFLDRVKPGWALKVKVPKLNLANGKVCILGQVYGNYHTAVSDVFDKKYARARALGFDTMASYESWKYESEAKRYCNLTKLWAFEVGKRQSRVRT